MSNDSELTVPIIEQIEALEEVKRLKRLGKNPKKLKQFAEDELAQELMFTLDYLCVDIKKFSELLIQKHKEWE